MEETSMTSIAIIGTGVVGERIINQALQSEHYTITAIFDENTERLQAMSEKYNVKAAENLDALLEQGADWVYIGTPPVSHAPLAEKIAAKGYNILSEKPLAHDAKDGEVMVQVAREAGVKTAMHFPMMYSPVVNDLKQLLANNQLGMIQRIELHTYFPHWPRKWQQNPWIASREQGGFIREIFPHYLQVLHHLFGDLEITAHQTTYPKDETLCETGVTAFGKTEQNIPVVLNAVANIGQEERIDFKVFGDKKVVSIRNWSELWIGEKDEPLTQQQPSSKPYNLLEACRRLLNNEETFVVPFEEGLKVQKWIDQLLK
jgi:predicted dehydrogenase